MHAESLKHPYLEDCPSNSIVKAYAGIVTYKLQDVEKHLRIIISSCLADWTALPPHCINPQIRLLQQFQQVTLAPSCPSRASREHRIVHRIVRGGTPIPTGGACNKRSSRE